MTKFYFTENQSFVKYSLNTCKYYVHVIKLETKMMRLNKNRVKKISLFHLKKCADNYFWLLHVMFQVNQFDLCTEVYHICILYKS